ncbi:spermidine synthase [Streptomyces sp. E11-3]|uniref:spermidine synthase n=1 Tax=Streptomyces sp. E11-3 TaxID=3110112 RepID=UPI00398152B5
MRAHFEELDWQPTPLGEISLRRRRDLATDTDVYEVKLGDEFLMSSMFTAGEVALARLGLEATPGTRLDVLVGGLGLGYTADAVLDDPRVRSLTVLDALGEVIDWHKRGLVPLGPRLTKDPRCRLVQGDFFARAAGAAAAAASASADAGVGAAAAQGLDPEAPGRRFHAILVDIDHSPDHVLHPSHAALYGPDGLRALSGQLHPGGIFALWSNDPPSDAFTAALATAFPWSEAHVVSFANPLQESAATNTVYVAGTAAGSVVGT